MYDYDVAKREQDAPQAPAGAGRLRARGSTTRRCSWPPRRTARRCPSRSSGRSRCARAAPQPLLLYGYGSYGYPMDVHFSSTRLSLLDRGMVFAVAHVRGGGDRGRLWYDDGQAREEDEHLHRLHRGGRAPRRRGWTAPDRLVIQGGSAGGLLMGAVANLRPDLFRAVVSEVPFVDVVSTMLDATLPLTTQEYIEWGNPNREKDYRTIRAYSPYDNIGRKAYPGDAGRGFAQRQPGALLGGGQVRGEAARAEDGLRTSLLLKTILEAGHGGASGRYDALKDLAFTYAFVLDQVGLAGRVDATSCSSSPPAWRSGARPGSRSPSSWARSRPRRASSTGSCSPRR